MNGLKKLEALPLELQAALRAHILQATSSDVLMGSVLLCRCNSTYSNPEIVRLQFSVSQGLQPLLEQILRFLVAQGAQIKFGPAPRSSAERQAQTALQLFGKDS